QRPSFRIGRSTTTRGRNRFECFGGRMNTITVKTQQEWDALPKSFEEFTKITIVGELSDIDSNPENSQVVVSDSARIGCVSDSARIDYVYGSASIGCVSDSARIGC